jgi:CRP/FNR family transcriptional regulator, cyclic AMP receptor protein
MSETMTEAQAKSVLAEMGWLAGEPAWMRDAMLACSSIRGFGAGELTHMVGDEPGGMFGIVAGSFGVMIPTTKSELALCHVLRPGVWFGMGPILTGGPRALSYRALERCTVLHAPLANLTKIGQRYPEFFRRIGILSESSYFTVGIRILGDLLIPTSERRVAAVLCRLGGLTEARIQHDPWPIPLSQAEIGQMSNCSRDRANRALQKFSKAGWIALQQKRIVIRDRTALENFVQGGSE